MSDPLRIIVSGLVGLSPVGGMAWHYFQYVLGLARLGHDVYYHEDTWAWPFHPIENRYTSEGDYSARYIKEFINRYSPDLRGHWHYLHLHAQDFGMTREVFRDVARTADVFLNVSGASMIPEGLSPSCVKIFLDTDPGYNQIVYEERFSWSENVDRWCSLVDAHDEHFTFAENIYGTDCLVPRGAFDWKVTRMPIVIDCWRKPRLAKVLPEKTWSTVMTWNAFRGRLVYKGVEYGSKGKEFENYIDLPRRTGIPLRVAVGGINAPLTRLREYGWEVLDAPKATLTPSCYQEFVSESRAEFSTAKHVYVAMRTGWFSERSACYLACGRPTVVQDTGFSKHLPTGYGLLTFRTPDEALSAMEDVEHDYVKHSESALELANNYFDSNKVLTELIDSIGNDRFREISERVTNDLSPL